MLMRDKFINKQFSSMRIGQLRYQVAQIAELRHQAILAEHGQQVADDARQYRDLVENQARAAIQESGEQIEAF